MGRKPVETNDKELIEMPLNGVEDAPEAIKELNHALAVADTAVANSIKAKSPKYILERIRGEFATRHKSDVSAIEMCYLTEKRWNEFGVGGEFLDYARDETGKGAETIRRYSHIGKMMNEFVPAKYRNTLWCRPIRNLVALAQAVNEHGNFTDDEWHILSRCINGQEVRLKLDEILEKERKPTNRLSITMDREGGLTAVKRNKREPIGMLRLEPENDLVAEAVQRIIASAGILEI